MRKIGLAVIAVLLSAGCEDFTGPIENTTTIYVSNPSPPAPFLTPFSPHSVQIGLGWQHQASMDVYRPANVDPKNEIFVSTSGDPDVVDVGELKSMKLREMPCPGDCRIVWRVWVNVWGFSHGYRAIRFEAKGNPEDHSTQHIFVTDVRG